MNTTDIQRHLIEKASIQASNILEKNYVSVQSLCGYLECIDENFLYKKPVSDAYFDYVNSCNKNIKPMGRTSFSRMMIQCGFRIKPIKKNKKVMRCFYY